MNVFLNSPGIVEFELKPGDSIIGHETYINHCDEGIKFGVFYKEEKDWRSVFKKQKSISSFTNILDVNQFLVFDYNTDRFLNQIEIVDLRKVHSDLVILYDSFFAGTTSVEIREFEDKKKHFLKIQKASPRKVLRGNGTVFLKKRKDDKIKKIQLAKDKSLIINPEEVFAFSKSALKEGEVKTIKGYGLHFVGPGDVYLISEGN